MGFAGNLSKERFSPTPPSKDFASNEPIFDCLTRNATDNSGIGNHKPFEQPEIAASLVQGQVF